MKNKLKTAVVFLELCCLVSLVFLSGYGVKQLGPSGFAYQMGLSIGITAGVPENDYNKLAQALKEKDKALTERERNLAKTEMTVLNAQRENNTRLVWLIMAIGFVLLSLILINFYLDKKRRTDTGYTIKIRK